MTERDPNEEQSPEYSPRFDSYDEFLENYYPNEPNRTPDPIQPKLTIPYRTWRVNTPQSRPKFKIDALLQRGEANIYGVHQIDHGVQTGLRPVYGPPTLDQMYPDPIDYGEEYEYESENSPIVSIYLNQHGYDIVNRITKGELAFDHQIWMVRKANRLYACKVVSFRFFFERTPPPKSTSVPMAKMSKESEVLQECHQDNIIRVFDVIKISDQITGFHQVFLATVMEFDGGRHR